MMRSIPLLAFWTFLAGAGIPLIGVLNGGVARSMGNPIGATAVMFAIAFLAAAALALPLYGVPTVGQLTSAPIGSYTAGILIGFYALSATVIIPRFGAGNFVAFILVAQLVTAAVIDQFGLLGVERSPIGALKLGGFALIIFGIALLQLASYRAAPS